MGRKKDGDTCCLLCGAATFCCLVVTLVLALLGLGITKIVVGAMNLNNCSIDRFVPIWLIVSGVTPIMYSGFSRQTDEGTKHNICGAVYVVIGLLFNIFWIICGSLWVYPTFGTVMANDFQPCTGNTTTECIDGDCNKFLITFAFAMVTVDWIFIVLWLSLIGYLIYNHNMSK